jgi:hypothetical protein
MVDHAFLLFCAAASAVVLICCQVRGKDGVGAKMDSMELVGNLLFQLNHTVPVAVAVLLARCAATTELAPRTAWSLAVILILS